MLDTIPSRWLIGGALVSLIAGFVLLYAGYARVGPVLLFMFVLLTILAAIRMTTPPITNAPTHESDSRSDSGSQTHDETATNNA